MENKASKLLFSIRRGQKIASGMNFVSVPDAVLELRGGRGTRGPGPL